MVTYSVRNISYRLIS